MDLFMSKNEYKNYRHELQKQNIHIKEKDMDYLSKIVFYGIPLFMFLIFNILLKVKFYWIPMYFFVSSCVDLLIEHIYINVIPQKEVNRRKKEEETRKIQEINQKSVFTLNNIYKLIKEFSEWNYPEYIVSSINTLMEKLRLLAETIENPEQYKTFFTIHLIQVLDIVRNDDNSKENQKLSLDVINNITKYVDEEIFKRNLGVNMDKTSTLTAYKNLYGGKFDA